MKLEHQIPDDDFEHAESFDCGCKPYKLWRQGVGTKIVHREMLAVELESNVFPEDWLPK